MTGCFNKFLERSLLLILVATGLATLAQDSEKIYPLKKQLKESSGKMRYQTLCNLSWEYRVAQPDSGLYYARQAFNLGKELSLVGLAESVNLIGLSSYHKGNTLDAYENFRQALNISEDQRDSSQIAHSNNNLGRLFLEQGMMPRALDHLYAAMEIFYTINDSTGYGFAYQNLGNYYQVNNKAAEAEENFKKALRVRLLLGETNETVSSLLQLGRLYGEQKKYDAALRQFAQADSLANHTQDNLLKADIKEELARCYLAMQQLDKAEDMAAIGLSRINNSGNGILLPKTFLTLGRIQLAKGNKEKARQYFTQTLTASAQHKDLKAKLDAYFLLWQSARAGTQQDEFEYYSNYMNLKDSIRGMESRQRESQLQFQLEIERKDAENTLLKAKEERKSLIIAIQVVFIVVAVAFVLNLIRNRRKILQANKLLDQKNHEVENINGLLAAKSFTLENHMTAIMDFSKNKNIALGNMQQAAKDIVSITARKLNISQVSIWLYNDVEACIETLAVYNLHQQIFLPTMKLHFDDAPQYFSTIKRERILVSDDARTNPNTKEFTEHYFKPNDIHSLLDATFSLDGQLRGLLCCEQQQAVRYWTTEDKLFVSSIADIISLALRSAQRLEYEKHIKEQNRKIASMNEVLEERVKQRTHELEEQNKRLSEYGFINSHMLRGPVSRVLGLIGLIQREPAARELDLMNHLVKSGTELDEIVKKITMALNDGIPLTIEELKKKRDSESEGNQ